MQTLDSAYKPRKVRVSQLLWLGRDQPSPEGSAAEDTCWPEEKGWRGKQEEMADSEAGRGGSFRWRPGPGEQQAVMGPVGTPLGQSLGQACGLLCLSRSTSSFS